MAGTAPSFIQLRDGTLVSTHTIVQLYANTDVIIFRFVDGTEKREYWPEGEGSTAFLSYKTQLIPGYAVGDLVMQPMFGDADAPVSNPADVAKPAFYRGRTNNTLWFWDTDEGAWFPVVTT